MQVSTNGTQAVSRSRTFRNIALSALAAVLAVGALVAVPTTTRAASQPKVVIVVGPVESNTSRYKRIAKGYASQARAYGAHVVEVYSPKATWSRVKAAADGANILIYLGHGNGYPSPYGAFSAARRNGMGLNARSGHGNSNVKYRGQKYMKTLDLDPNSVVLLNHLCYASGNSEPGRKKPSLSTAKQRADGYATGFLRAGARAVFANGHAGLDFVLGSLLTTDASMGQIFESDWAFDGGRDFTFGSKHVSWATVWMDPEGTKSYYHSVVGRMNVTAAQVRGG